MRKPNRIIVKRYFLSGFTQQVVIKDYTGLCYVNEVRKLEGGGRE